MFAKFFKYCSVVFFEFFWYLFLIFLFIFTLIFISTMLGEHGPTASIARASFFGALIVGGIYFVFVAVKVFLDEPFWK
tara:strand:- start:318 stop:551 length:234 start_codon:yes stop_codon:yes gene_type:complete